MQSLGHTTVGQHQPNDVASMLGRHCTFVVCLLCHTSFPFQNLRKSVLCSSAAEMGFLFQNNPKNLDPSKMDLDI